MNLIFGHSVEVDEGIRKIFLGLGATLPKINTVSVSVEMATASEAIELANVLSGTLKIVPVVSGTSVAVTGSQSLMLSRIAYLLIAAMSNNQADNSKISESRFAALEARVALLERENAKVVKKTEATVHSDGESSAATSPVLTKRKKKKVVHDEDEV